MLARFRENSDNLKNSLQIRETGFAELRPPPPSLRKLTPSSPHAEQPLLQPFLANDRGDFPVSAQGHRLQSRIWCVGLRRQKSRSKLDLGSQRLPRSAWGNLYGDANLSRPLTEWRRWHAEQEARFAAERARSGREERRLGTRPLSVADVETLIACALAEALELALATERGQDDRSAESVEERELTGMSAF
jgi:hypothetical protein